MDGVGLCKGKSPVPGVASTDHNDVGCVDILADDFREEFRQMEYGADGGSVVQRDFSVSVRPSEISSVAESSAHTPAAENAITRKVIDKTAIQKSTKRNVTEKGKEKKAGRTGKGSRRVAELMKSARSECESSCDDDDGGSNGSSSSDEDSDSSTVLERSIAMTSSGQSDFVSVQYSEPTPLYKAIEDEDWSNILTFLQTDDWGWRCNVFCDSYYNTNENSASVQARTWVGTTDEEGDICRLPLHAAIVRQAPFAVIQSLVRLYRKGVRYPDSDGNYPLHLAFHVGSPLRVVTLLLKEYPPAINKKNAESLLPDECGSGNEVGDILRMCIEETRASVTKKVMKQKKPMEEERKQLVEVTSELMQLKKLVSERERNVAKDTFLFQRNQLSGAIAELTNLKQDLEKHEESLLKHSLEEEKKRTEEVIHELLETKKELEHVKSVQKKMNEKLGNSVDLDSVEASINSESNKNKNKKDKKNKGKDKKENRFAKHSSNSKKLDGDDVEVERSMSTKTKSTTTSKTKSTVTSKAKSNATSKTTASTAISEMAKEMDRKARHELEQVMKIQGSRARSNGTSRSGSQGVEQQLTEQSAQPKFLTDSIGSTEIVSVARDSSGPESVSKNSKSEGSKGSSTATGGENRSSNSKKGKEKNLTILTNTSSVIGESSASRLISEGGCDGTITTMETGTVLTGLGHTASDFNQQTSAKEQHVLGLKTPKPPKKTSKKAKAFVSSLKKKLPWRKQTTTSTTQ